MKVTATLASFIFAFLIFRAVHSQDPEQPTAEGETESPNDDAPVDVDSAGGKLSGRMGFSEKYDCPGQYKQCYKGPTLPAELGSVKNGRFIISGQANTSVYWRNVKLTDVKACVERGTPGGVEGGGEDLQFVCRVNDNQWQPGKMLYHETVCYFVCEVGAAGVNNRVPLDRLENRRIQVLLYKKTDLEWVPLSMNQAPLVIGGYNLHNEMVGICRKIDEHGNKYIGQYFPLSKTCWYPHGREEIREGKASNIELLVPTGYSRRCEVSSSTCKSKSSGVEHVELGAFADSKIRATGKTRDEVKWHPAQRVDLEACVKDLPEAGVDNDHDLYICRALHKSHWVHGTIFMDNSSCTFACSILVEENVVQVSFDQGSKIQILSYEVEQAGWTVLHETNNKVRDLVIGGRNMQEDMIAICRYDEEKGNKLIGQFDGTKMVCSYPEGGKAKVGDKADKIELLALVHKSGANANCGKVFSNLPPDVGVPAEFYHPIEGFSRLYFARLGFQWRYVDKNTLDTYLTNGTSDSKQKLIENLKCRTNYQEGRLTFRRLQNTPTVRSGYLEFDESLCDFVCKIDKDTIIPLSKIGPLYKYQIQVPINYNDITPPCRNPIRTCPAGKREAVDISTFQRNLEAIEIYSNADVEANELEPRTETDAERLVVQWRTVLGDEVPFCVNQTIPAGSDYMNVPLYICRHKQFNPYTLESTWQLGIIAYNDEFCQYYCDRPSLDSVARVPILNDGRTQILMMPSMTQCWVEYQFDIAIKNAIMNSEGSKDWLLCRVASEGAIHVGQFSTILRQCFYTVGEHVIAEPDPEDIEILTVNEADYSHCPNEKGEHVEYGVRDKRNSFKIKGRTLKEDLKWRTVQGRNVRICLAQTTPSGYEPDIGPQYLCKVPEGKTYDIGTISYDDRACMFTCDVGWGFGAKLYPVDDESAVQILAYQPSHLKWERITNPKKPPKNMIVGGRTAIGGPVPVCRYVASPNETYVGKIGHDYTFCSYLAQDNIHEHVAVKTSVVEVLVLI